VRLNKFVVSAYKIVGFFFLSVILVGLVGYLGTNLFFLVDSTWISPSVISPSDERVLALSAQYAQQSSLREKVAAERFELAARRSDLQRTELALRGFQGNYRHALQADLAAKEKALASLQGLLAEYHQGKTRITEESQAYTAVSRERMRELAQAHLLETDGWIAGNIQLSQIEHGNLSLAEREVTLANQCDALLREVQALKAVLRDEGAAAVDAGALSYDSLRLQQEYAKAVLEQAKAGDMAQAIGHSITAVDGALARYDQVLKGIRESPYMRASEHSVTVGGVPYENARSAGPGTPLYACRLGILVCRKVGEVVASIDGEVPVKHPLHSQLLRGQLVELALTEGEAVRHRVLFARHPPLFF
jgi:hypothetical protein